MVLPLREIIENNAINKASLTEALLSFCCHKDLEVQSFLQEKAIIFEENRQTSTFLLFNEKAAHNGHLQLDGYFSLALKVFSFSEDISNRQRKKISGKTDREVPAYLVGQLARNDSAPKGVGNTMLNLAIQYIRNAQYFVGGKIVYLDCKDFLIPYYEKCGFKFIQKSQKDSNLNQMYLII